MRHIRPASPTLSPSAPFPKDAVVSVRVPLCLPLPPEQKEAPQKGLDQLGYSPEQVDHLLSMVRLEKELGITVSAGATFAALLTPALDDKTSPPKEGWLARVNAHDVRPPYHSGVNPDLDLFLEANQVDFPEGTSLCELHHRLVATFTAEDEADLVQEGLRLALGSSSPSAPFNICLDEFWYYGGTGPSDELWAKIAPRHQTSEQEEAAFLRNLILEAQAVSDQDPRHPDVTAALNRVRPVREGKGKGLAVGPFDGTIHIDPIDQRFDT